VNKAFPVVYVCPTDIVDDDVRLHVVPFSAASLLPFEGEYVLVYDPDSALQGTGRVHRVSYQTKEIQLSVTWTPERTHAY
jgi:hypothetical protein